MFYDIIVMGSGPSACAAALRCRRIGLSVLIVTERSQKDSEEFYEGLCFRPKESICLDAGGVIAGLEVGPAFEAARSGSYLGVISAGGACVPGFGPKGPQKGFNIDRSLFDCLLLEMCMGKGVDVLFEEKIDAFVEQGRRITGVRTSSGKKIAGRYVIDGTGVGQMGGRRLGLKKLLLSPPFKVWTGIGAMKGNFESGWAYFIPRKTGWTWLAPEADGRCSWTRLSHFSLNSYDPPAQISVHSITHRSVFNRRWRIYRPVCKAGVILCGDAAGVLDPAAGQGVLNALETGHVAGDLAHRIFCKPEREAAYLEEYDKWFFNRYMQKAILLDQLYGINLKQYYE